MQDLPPVYQPKKSSFTRFLYSLITLFIMLAALPIGVYLVGHQTSFQQKAAENIVTKVGESSYSLVNASGSQTVAEGVVPVDVVVQSEKSSANLFVIKLSFPKDQLNVQSVATSQANPDEKQKNRYFSDKWVVFSDRVEGKYSQESVYFPFISTK